MSLARISMLTIMMLCLAGCGHVISKDILKEVDASISFSALKRSPETYKGRVVLLGGVIVKSANKRDGTILEVYQTEIDRRGEPMNVDVSEGRFLAHYNGFLDTAIYRNGRKVTIVGIIQGEQAQRLGKLTYHYPHLLIKDIYLWKEEHVRRYDHYRWDHWGPWWYPRSPWYDPYWRYR